MVRGKFQLQEVRNHSYSETSKTLVFRPQYDHSIPEDQKFSTATPSGELTMLVNNPQALEQLTIGKQYYLDLTVAE